MSASQDTSELEYLAQIRLMVVNQVHYIYYGASTNILTHHGIPKLGLDFLFHHLVEHAAIGGGIEQFMSSKVVDTFLALLEKDRQDEISEMIFDEYRHIEDVKKQVLRTYDNVNYPVTFDYKYHTFGKGEQIVLVRKAHPAIASE